MVQGVTSFLFRFYRNYPPIDDFSFPTVSVVEGNRQFIGLQFPQQLQNARTFFNCPSMQFVPFEDGGGSGSSGSHWEQRIFDVRCWPAPCV